MDTDAKTVVGRIAALPGKLGPYRVVGLLGSGGFGSVYKAIAPSGEAVALKVLTASVSEEEFVLRFEREAQIRIDHPNVVRVLDAGCTDDGQPFIALELLEGESFSEKLRSAPLPAAEVQNLVLQACAGLAAAHARGIVHRDLKPGNLFIRTDGTVKVLDFGIARLTSSDTSAKLTVAGAIIGTPGYFAPEQARGEPDIDVRADVWALGVILYQALAGVQPFLRDTLVATMLAVVLEEPKQISEVVRLPRGLDAIVHRCLAKDREARWPSISALRDALAALELSRELVSEPPSLPAPIAADEQRVVALVLAEGVDDAPLLDAAVREFGGELIPMLGARAIAVFGAERWEGDEIRRAVSAAQRARRSAGWIAVASGRASGARGAVSGDAVRAVERACDAHVSGVALDAVAARGLPGVALRRHPGDVLEISVDTALEATSAVLREDLPLLGRQIELGQLQAALAAFPDEARPIVVWLTGPPGVGKSRLRAEVERWLRGRDEPPMVLSVRAESHRRDAALNVVAAMLRSAPPLEPVFAEGSTLPALEKAKAVERFLEDATGDAELAREGVERLGPLLGLGTEVSAPAGRSSDPQLLADRVRVALAEVLEAMCRRQPVALVLDDAQWADEASLKFLEELLGRVADAAVLVAIAARPELSEQRPELFAGQQIVRIEPRGLATPLVGQLGQAIAGRPLDDRLVKTIADRTGGNPFFVEQIVRELVERQLLDTATDELPIPLDVEGAIQSRLDHLPGPEKQLCRWAAVFGRSVSSRAVQALGIDDPSPLLASLAKRGILAAKSRPSNDEDREYQFRSSLVSDVAYRMNAEESLAELHRRAAAFLAREASADAEEIARHHERAGAREPAARFYAAAVQAATRRGDTPSVLRCSERALGLGAPSEVLFDLHMARADALSFLGRRSEQGKELEAALARADLPAERARALTEKAALLASLASVSAAQRVAAEAVAVARAAGSPDVLATALAREAWTLLYGGKVDDAAVCIDEATRCLPQARPETAALVEAWRAQLATARGDLAARRSAFERAIALYRDVGDVRRAAAAECNLADTYNRFGAYAEAEAKLRESVEGCRRVGNRVMEGFAFANLGYALTMLDRIDDALEAFASGERVARSAGQARLAIAVRVYRGRALLRCRPPDEVVREAEAAADEARRGGMPALCVSALAVAAQAHLAAGNAHDALALSRRAMQLRDELGTLEEDEAEVFLTHAQALLASGRIDEARSVLTLGKKRLDALAARIEDPEWRGRFLSNVAAHRDLIALAGTS